MTISARSRGKLWNTSPTFPLKEVQIDTVSNPEPQGISAESRYNYFLILCDRFSRIFRLNDRTYKLRLSHSLLSIQRAKLTNGSFHTDELLYL